MTSRDRDFNRRYVGENMKLFDGAEKEKKHKAMNLLKFKLVLCTKISKNGIYNK